MDQVPHFVFRLLTKLEAAKIHYSLRRIREETIMVFVHVPGRYYEIEVYPDESVEVEIFSSSGYIGGHEMIEELFTNYSD